MRESTLSWRNGSSATSDALLAHLDPDVVWDNTGQSPPDHDGVFRGKAEVTRIFWEWVDSWEDYRIEVEEVVEGA